MGPTRKPRLIRVIVVTLLVAIVLVLAGAAAMLAPLALKRGEYAAQGRQWADALKRHSTFSARPRGYPLDASFAYAVQNDGHLKQLRERYDLDAIAGKDSETERIVNLMAWVFRLTGHANEPEIPKELNALNLIRLAQVEHMQINCFMKTVILNEVYLAMGFASRQTHLLPFEHEEDESHLVTSVYSRTLGRWILMDPDFGAYVTDEKGRILGVAEIRGRMIRNEPMRVVSVDTRRSLRVRAWESLQDFARGVDYFWFLSEFVFKIRCPLNSAFDESSQPSRVYLELIPDGYRPELLGRPEMTQKGATIHFTNDEGAFWQKPAGQDPGELPPDRR